MGERANVVVISRPSARKIDGIFFYSHWDGLDLLPKLQNALKIANADNRLNDEPYLNRMIFCNIVDSLSGTRGYGITTYLTDNNYPIILVDPQEQTISLVKEQDKNTIKDLMLRRTEIISFEDFMSLEFSSDKSWSDWTKLVQNKSTALKTARKTKK